MGHIRVQYKFSSINIIGMLINKTIIMMIPYFYF